MLIHTLWFWRKGEDGPEMLEAWEEYATDQKWDGWQAACAKALDSVKGDISSLGYRYIDLRVDGSIIEQMFYSNEIEATVEEEPVASRRADP